MENVLHRLCFLIAFAITPMLAGCAAATNVLDTNVARSPVAPGTVFVADGAGNYQLTSGALRNVVNADKEPIEVITHEWSHGAYRILADHLHQQHALDQGKRLADLVLAYRGKHPDQPIYLLSHSAGSTVVIAALENLPPGIVERAILLSPSISAEYDIRPALRSVKQSMNVFYSPYDYFYLGAATRIFGTPDHRWTAPAGRTGFHIHPDAEDAGKLVQRRWQPADCMLGNNGGHYGNYQPNFLRTHIVPLFSPIVITPQAPG